MLYKTDPSSIPILLLKFLQPVKYKFNIIILSMATFIQKIRKSKIELTQRENSMSRQNTRSRERVEIRTPPKFRMLTESQVDRTSRYQSSYKNNNPSIRTKPSVVSRETSLKKKALMIDTDTINQQFEAKEMRRHNQSLINNPLLAGEDSVTILSRMQAKRKQERSANMKGNNSVSEDDFMINHSKDHFTLSESKVAIFESLITTKNQRQPAIQKAFQSIGELKLISLKTQLEDLKKILGSAGKICKIEQYIDELHTQLLFQDKLQSAQSQYSFKMALPDQNQIQNMFLKENRYCWQSKSKQCSPLIEDKKKIRTMNIGRQNLENVERVSFSGGLRSRCPLTEIVNYVNRKR